MGLDFGITEQEVIHDHPLRFHNHLYSFPNDTREAIQREILKEKIRGEIIMAEIARIRNLMMSSNGFPSTSAKLEFGSLTGHKYMGNTAEEEPLKENTVRLVETCERESPFQISSPVESRISEAELEEGKEKWRNIFLGKPDTSEVKGKMSSTTVDPTKTNEWSCSLCGIIAPNKTSLDQHWRGLKHKSKEAALEKGFESIHVLETKDSSMGKQNEWSCALCGIVAPNYRSLEQHWQGKKHKSMEIAQEKGYSEPIHDVGTMDSSTVKHKSKEAAQEKGSEFIHVLGTKDSSMGKQSEWSCALCGIVAPNERSLNQHRRGEKHKSMEATQEKSGSESIHGVGTMDSSTGKQSEWSCALCGIITPSKVSLDQHRQGKKHRSKSNRAAQKKGLVSIHVETIDSSMEKHSEWSCALCGIIASSKISLDQHWQGKKHRSNNAAQKKGSESIHVVGTMDSSIGKQSREWSCAVCGIIAITKGNPNQHRRGKRHKKRLESINAVETIDSSMEKQSTEWSCALCGIVAPNGRSLNQHRRGKKHKSMEATQEKGSQSIHVVETIDSSMGKRYKEWSCALCGIIAPSKISLDQHRQGKKHRSNKAAQKKGSEFTHVEAIDYSFMEKQSQWSCALCGIVASDQRNLNQHRRGKKHKANEAAQKKGSEFIHVEATIDSSMEKQSEWSCALCGVVASNKRNLNQHLQGKKHKLNEAAQKKGSEFIHLETIESSSMEKQSTIWSCALCGIVAPNKSSLDQHQQGKKHKSKEAAQKKGSESIHAEETLETTHLLRKSSEEESKLKNQMSEYSKTKDEPKSENSFWRDICNLETLSLGDMNSHKEGKKHMNRPEEIKKDCGDGNTPQSGTSTLLSDHEPCVAAGGKNISESDVKTMDEPKSENKYRFWCSLCNVRTLSLEVMANHKKGKKHMSRQKQIDK